jgi:alanine racemase
MGTTVLSKTRVSFRETWAEVSLDAIYQNTKLFRNSINDSCRLMAVVKADGYGHGAIEVAKTALEAGADYLGVAFLDEAICLRKNGIKAPILLLGYTPPESIEEAIEHQITITVFTQSVLDKIITYTNLTKKQAFIHIKVDTGMGRIGVTTKEEALVLAQMSEKSNYVKLEGIFTHFSSADGEDPSYTKEQYNLFKTIYHFLELNRIQIPLKHCCNSAGTILFPEMHLDMVRVGISIYGLHPSSVTKKESLPLKQSFHLKTRIAALKTVQNGNAISYGRTFIADRATVVATLPIGYADGVSRKLSNQGYVMLNNRLAPIIGKVCMDQMMVDVSMIETKIGDEVTLFGGTENGFISLDKLAEMIETINYEVVCAVGKRVPRIYIRNNQIVEQKNQLFS